MRVRLLMTTAVLLACWRPIPAAEPGSKPADAATAKTSEPKTARAEFTRLSEELMAVHRKLWETQMQTAAPRLLALVEANPKDELAYEILRYLLTRPTAQGTAFKQAALKVLTQRYAADERIASFFMLVPADDTGRALLERVVAVNPDRTIQARALLKLGQVVNAAIDKTAEPEKQKALHHDAEAIFQRLVKEYGDVEMGRRTFREVAEGELKEMRLHVGRPFPELEGLAVSGAKEHLASYRGKVVVFDVWATWCGPCKAMIPHEREMVEKLKGEPFALISVSGDKEKADLDTFLKKTSMPWVHWWGQADDGKIMKALNIKAFPTIYVLDANGVIRYKNVRGEELTKAVEVCLAELKKK